ncbi:uncharacterized protein ASPGLDRAFT_1076507 [Aspergillus glaucus CBS 516.65]|uniref:Uncharacterized protein n=1 Tax=Aspergillus glaucus CBS 516.65 TaxID=1160497 RepID=A0A1L9V540_ASPGL|nr:hypothetical protein ASPGLDRAFT_1076507 [Aspergillus glaucus CBS 516.65]OJJ79030.1 hypothetical protein ASPGLDRAFT_1076507 [Aspergillus glaucus CBS 516.65]
MSIWSNSSVVPAQRAQLRMYSKKSNRWSLTYCRSRHSNHRREEHLSNSGRRGLSFFPLRDLSGSCFYLAVSIRCSQQ